MPKKTRKSESEAKEPNKSELEKPRRKGSLEPGISPGLRNPARQCTAKVVNEDRRCEAAARPGMTVCYVHGGNTPQVIAKAKERLLDMVDPALTQLLRIVQDSKTSDSDRLRAINAILNRVGLSEHAVVNIDTGERFTEILDLVTGRKREEIDPDLARIADSMTMGDADLSDPLQADITWEEA